ncbi:MAG: hypothetical protein IT580_17480, partial [Verrucomicrobiales bacterium]|nr:hypothetical protein [Verrucomicrobiales bacterium]
MSDPTPTAASPAVADLLQRLHGSDDVVRAAAGQDAGPLGVAAVMPLMRSMADPDREAARAAQRALWSVVHHAGRPGAKSDRAAVAARLAEALESNTEPVATRRELLWMLSAIGGNTAVDTVAARLNEMELREDARCALQRIPGRRSLRALKAALATAQDDFAAALADALRARGETVRGRP